VHNRLPSCPTQLSFAGADCWLARIGYSGETGYELVIDDAAAPALWEALRAAGERDGLLECGFAAINTLRIEAGHMLFTHELAAPATPAELGLTRLIDTCRTNFLGARTWRSLRGRVPPRRLVGLLPSRSVTVDAALPTHPAAGSAVVTSACRSPLFERELALGFVPAADAYPGSVVRLTCGARAQVARLPFYDPARRLPRLAR
jgi:aminomethyltransferase